MLKPGPQEEIPSHPFSKTECGRIRSREGCQFGINWNEYKVKHFTTKRAGAQKQRIIFAKYKGELFTVLALYAYYSEARNEFAYDTILLKEVKDENKYPLCDHLWVKAPRYVPASIKPGDLVKVSGRIQEYERLDGSKDYTLFVHTVKRGFFD